MGRKREALSIQVFITERVTDTEELTSRIAALLDGSCTCENEDGEEHDYYAIAFRWQSLAEVLSECSECAHWSTSHERVDIPEGRGVCSILDRITDGEWGCHSWKERE